MAEADIAFVAAAGAAGLALSVSAWAWRLRRWVGHAALGQGDAVIEAGQFERILDAHFRQRLGIGEVQNAELHLARVGAELGWQVGEGGFGQAGEVVQGRGGVVGPGEGVVGHEAHIGLRRATGNARSLRGDGNPPFRFMVNAESAGEDDG